MDPTTINVSALESRSTSKAQIPPTPLEIHVGKLVALAASAIAAGVRDYGAAGRMTVATKRRVADLFAQLYELRQMMVGTWDFDGIAHQYGRVALAAACGGASAAEQAIIDTLIDTTMDVLRKVTRSQVN